MPSVADLPPSNGVRHEQKSSVSQLDALVSLISSSVSDINVELGSSGLPSPSLEVGSSNWRDNLPDASRAMITKATRIIEAACAQLRATVSQPEHVLIDVRIPLEVFLGMLIPFQNLENLRSE